MLSINTNLSSLIAQNSLTNSTTKLNQAIERMTTGFKINHAKDNAANYSIATNLTTKIGAYMVAEDNCAMGLDMLATATGSLDQISDKLSRLRALAEQAGNGTYGEQSLKAINAEANALVDEVERLYNTAEYNGKKLFIPNEYPIPNDIGPQVVAVSTYNLATETTYTETDIQAMTKVADVSTFTSGEKYSISTVEELEKFRDMVNSGIDTTGVEFVLGDDIDMSLISNWTPIGETSSACFKGTFEGNGHVIKNLTIDNPTKRYQGLFGYALQANFKNINIYNVNIIAEDCVGSLIGYLSNGGSVEKVSVENFNITSLDFSGGIIGLSSSTSSKALNISECSASGIIKNNTGEYSGGIFGHAEGYNSSNKNLTISNCTADVEIIGTDYCGGIGGFFENGYVNNCNAIGKILGVAVSSESAGGLFGKASRGEISNSTFKGSVTASDRVGGLVGDAYELLVTNCSFEGNVQGKLDTGGVIGFANDTHILNCGANANVTGNEETGGFCGKMQRGSSITNSYIKGELYGSKKVGGAVGNILLASDYITSINNNIIIANTSGGSLVGSVVGNCYIPDSKTTIEDMSIENCQVLKSGYPMIAGFTGSGTRPSHSDLVALSANVKLVTLPSNETLLQVGINNSNNQIGLEVSFEFMNILKTIAETGIDDSEYFNIIDKALNNINAKQTEYGAVQNRLESAIDEISTQYENLVSSRSTIRDADIAEVSSEYIRQQILQQASATLMATANQSPAIALQLI